MLCQMWVIGEKLRQLGHFFVLTGRSAYLHLLGKQNKDFAERPNGFESPNRMELVSLDVLSQDSIQQVFEGHKVKQAGKWIHSPGILADVEALTGGIPRAVTSVLISAEIRRSPRRIPPSRRG